MDHGLWIMGDGYEYGYEHGPIMDMDMNCFAYGT